MTHGTDQWLGEEDRRDMRQTLRALRGISTDILMTRIATHEAFFGEWYRTGDLGRRDA